MELSKNDVIVVFDRVRDIVSGLSESALRREYPRGLGMLMFVSTDQVYQNEELSADEKDRCLRELRTGKRCVWVVRALCGQCPKSPDGNHHVQHPRLEDSIDRSREVPQPYCKFCFCVGAD